VCAFFLAIPVTPLQPPDYITGRPLLQGQVSGGDVSRITSARPFTAERNLL
jgi:hypothetical protein